MSDSGDLVSIYNQGQSIKAGAGDVLLKFYGEHDTGFRSCETIHQTLTRGSQYQTSFLPELKRFESYKMKVEARYKDFIPVIFELEVKYLSNLDGKTKFVDLGTHIFYKHNQTQEYPYKLLLTNVLDDGIDDDYNNYQINLSDPMMVSYLSLEN